MDHLWREKVQIQCLNKIWFQNGRLFFVPDFATLMSNLEHAFKKYNVHDNECQVYVACEAAQLERHEENGPLAKAVYDIVE